MRDFKPYINIAGYELSNDPYESLAPLKEITIKWGTSSLWEDIEPSCATLTILDTLGYWTDIVALGQQVKVYELTANTDIALFRGYIEEARTEYTPITNPKTGDKQDAWTIEIQAIDKLGVLQKDRAHGINTPGYAGENFHWAQNLRDRRLELEKRAACPINWSTLEYTPQDLAEWLAPYELNQNVSALTVLRNTARAADITARPYYDPLTDEIRFQNLKTPSTIGGRSWNAVNESLRITGNSSCLILDGNKIHPLEGYTLQLTALDNVTRIAVNARRLAENSENKLELIALTQIAGIDSGEGSQTTVQLESDYRPPVQGVNKSNDYLREASERVRAILRATRQQLAPPPFEISIDTSSDTSEPGFHPIPIEPVYIAHSVMNWGGRLDAFSIRGGEIIYRPGKFIYRAHPVASTFSLGEVHQRLGEVASSVPIGEVNSAELISDFERIH